MDSIARLFSRFGNYIRSEELRSLCRSHASDFTRVYKFPWYDRILYMIFRSEKCVSSELSKYFNAIGKPENQISKQALFKAAKKLNVNALIKLVHVLPEFFYETDLVKTYHGYILLAEDGTTLELMPEWAAILNYGFAKNQTVKDEFDATKAVSRSAALYDVINGLIVDFTMKRYTDAEMPMAIGHLQRTHSLYQDKKVIYLADRNYDSVELFALLELYGFNYCLRGKNNFFKHYIEKMASDDEWIEVTIDAAWLKRLKYSFAIERFQKDPKIRVRVVKRSYTYTDEKGIEQTQDLIFFTNLPKEEFDSDEIALLYSKRWQLEVSYKTLKSTLEWERYFSNGTNTETCSIYAKVIYHNLLGIVRKHLDAYLGNQFSNNKYQYQMNVAQLNEFLKHHKLVRMLRAGNRSAIRRMLEILLLLIHKIKVPVRPNRHFQRWGRIVQDSNPHRFSLDGRNYPRVRDYQGVLQTVKP